MKSVCIYEVWVSWENTERDTTRTRISGREVELFPLHSFLSGNFPDLFILCIHVLWSQSGCV